MSVRVLQQLGTYPCLPQKALVVLRSLVYKVPVSGFRFSGIMFTLEG